MLTVVSTPLDLPKLEPSNWNQWWQFWEQHAKPLKKIRPTPNKQSGDHFGFDVFRHRAFLPAYFAPLVDLKSFDAHLYDSIMNVPVKIYCARFIMSTGDFLPHVDMNFSSWAIRCMFHCDDPNPQWYYTDLKNENRQMLKLSSKTNWWTYLDGAIKHGTTFNSHYPKILLQLFTETQSANELAKLNIGRFPDETHTYDISA